MRKLDPTFSTVALAAAFAIVASVLLNQFVSVEGRRSAQQMTGSSAHAASTSGPTQMWAASATGRVEPKNGEVRIMAEAPAQIVDVIAETNDRVTAGDLLVKLDDDDLQQRLIAALSEADVRLRERDEDTEDGAASGLALQRREAEDTLYASQRATFRALNAFDKAYRAHRDGKGDAEGVSKAREALAAARKKETSDRETLRKLEDNANMPLPTRLESSLTVARSDVAQVMNAIEKTRVRAPQDGSVLNVWAKEGEMAAPSADVPLVLFGDISSLRVRAEVEERDVTRIRVGQQIVVKADGFPNDEFTGVVTQVAPALGAPRLTSRGPRRPNDVEVLEVLTSLDDNPPLLTGMRVDVFFRHEASASNTQ